MKFCFKALSSLCGEGLRSRCSRPALSRSVPKPSWARRVSPFTPESPPAESRLSCLVGAPAAPDPLPAPGLAVSRSFRPRLGLSRM